MLLEMQEFSDNPERVYSDRGKALLMAIDALEYPDWDDEVRIRRDDPDWNPTPKPIPDPSCPKCKGEGYTTIVGEGFHQVARCSCCGEPLRISVSRNADLSAWMPDVLGGRKEES
jgi:hypothetical protein